MPKDIYSNHDSNRVQKKINARVLLNQYLKNEKLMKTLYFLKSIPHRMNQMNLYQEEIKTYSQNTVQNCRDTRKWMHQKMKIVYFNHYIFYFQYRINISIIKFKMKSYVVTWLVLLLAFTMVKRGDPTIHWR